jgi:uncharacterized protein (DUF305 family)
VDIPKISKLKSMKNANDMATLMKNMNKRMDSMQMTGDTDRDFAEMMIVHHQAAIDMAEEELKSGHDPFLKNLADRIIKDQAKEIEEMQQWLKKHH